MASFVKTGEHYYKSLDVFKEKSDEFVRNIEIVRYHMASVIQRLRQNQSRFNILSVGSGTGEMDSHGNLEDYEGRATTSAGSRPDKDL